MEYSLIGKYKIIEHIGHGGMADVYKALHPELDRVVAIKVLSRTLVHSREMRERFRREARAIAALRHQNIVQVFDFDITDDVYFMVMEYIEGETLSQRLTDLRRREERIPLHEALRVVSAVGQALHYAHEQGMLHRDVKPSNIMFRGDESVVLADFGVAKILNASSDITQTGAVAGTPAYMAPEQWTDDEPDTRSDIYSLGVVLYQLATGELPFKDETPGRLMFKHISEPPPLPRKLYPGIPLELERIILRALAKDPKDRYQTAQHFVDDLNAVIYLMESTAPTGVFQRLSRSRIDNLVTDRKPTKLSGGKSAFFWLGSGAIVVFTIILIAFSLSRFGESGVVSPTPNATGTALAARLAALESTLSVSVTPQPEPSVTSTTPMQETRATATPLLSLNPSQSPAACALKMKLEQDVNFSALSWWSTASAPFEKKWRLRNDGSCPWPPDCALVHLDGNDFGLDKPYDVGVLLSGEEMELSVSLRAPNTLGRYEGRFQLLTADGVRIGEPLEVKLEVRLPASPVPAGLEAVQIAGFELISWTPDRARSVWTGKVLLWATGGTGDYQWYRDTLENPLPGDVLEFEWGICRDFFGSVFAVSGGTQDHESLYIPYPEPCD